MSTPTRTDATDGSALHALAFVPVALVGLAATGLAFLAPLTALLGVEAAVAVATVVSLALAVVAVVLDTPGGWRGRLHATAAVLGILALTAVTAGTIAGLVLAPTWLFLPERALAVDVAAALTLVLEAAVAVVVLAALADSGPRTDWALNVRMVAVSLLLCALTAVFLLVVWVLVFLGFSFVFGPGELPALVAALAVFLAVPVLVYEELAGARASTTRLDARPVDPGDYPDLYATVGRLATQFDVPKPTVRVADDATPEAMAVGFRPDSMTLVVSTGLLDVLDADERTAVIAHELAHVANRDAMVMTAVNAPVVIADGVRRSAEAGDGGSLKLLLAGLGGGMRFVARAVVAVLSRARESAADRAAVAVTGQPAALASALRAMDDRVADTPTRDLREVAGLSALSIVPLEPREVEKVMLGPDGERDPFMWEYRKPIESFTAAALSTHPPTEERIDALRDRQSDLAGASGASDQTTVE